MDKDKEDLWVDALLSNEYTQAHGSFINVDSKGKKSHCCLAVLTEVAIKNGCTTVRLEDATSESGQPYVEVHVNVDGDESHTCTVDCEFPEDGTHWTRYTDGNLPPPVSVWAGMDGDVNPELDGIQAIQRNDDNEDTFEEIAAAIRVSVA
jgi:hypothetical protein